MSSSSLEHCSLSCMRDDTCIGFNIKSSLTCDHVTTPGFNIKSSLTCDHVTWPVLASTSRARSPVITWRHLYWLQHQELTHLWCVQS